MFFQKLLHPSKWVIWLAVLPRLIKKMKTAIMTSRIMRKVNSSKITWRYLNDLAFRGSVSIYQGVAVNVFYVVFRIVAGIRYRKMMNAITGGFILSF